MAAYIGIVFDTGTGTNTTCSATSSEADWVIIDVSPLPEQRPREKETVYITWPQYKFTLPEEYSPVFAAVASMLVFVQFFVLTTVMIRGPPY